MKIILAILLAVVASASTQRNVDPRQAAILAEARYLSGDGSFGSAYVQEDGTDFKEETTADGTRRGSYSYIDPNGKKITVNYTAGKNGFQVSGDHLPKAPAPLPVPQPAAPVPQYQHQPQNQYNQISQQPNNQYQYKYGQDQHYNNFGQQAFVQTTTTPSPSRFFPPGKLNLNRTPDGFQYSFQSN